ncbi:MAG TPA: RcnB family protein [Granulicella sp.]
MNYFRKAVAFSTLALTLTSGAALAQRYDDHRGGPGGPGPRGGYVRHNEWKRGYHMNRNDWGRGQRIDYRRYRLSRPPRGYEWREVDGNYVMAAVATGVIASVVAAAVAGQ